MTKNICDFCGKMIGGEYFTLRFWPSENGKMFGYDICQNCYGEGINVLKKHIKNRQVKTKKK